MVGYAPPPTNLLPDLIPYGASPPSENSATATAPSKRPTNTRTN
jgi:hypothetical protein